MLHQVADLLRENKGERIVLLNVRDLSSVTDYYVLVSGTSLPHVKALFNGVLQSLKHSGVPCYRKSGTAESGWLVLDYIDLVVHIMTDEVRDYYDLEELWSDAHPVE